MVGDIPHLIILWSWIWLFSEAVSTSKISMCWPVLPKIQCFLIFTQKPWWYCKYVLCPCTHFGTNVCVRIHFDGLFRVNAKETCQWFFWFSTKFVQSADLTGPGSICPPGIIEQVPAGCVGGWDHQCGTTHQFWARGIHVSQVEAPKRRCSSGFCCRSCVWLYACCGVCWLASSLPVISIFC